MAFALGYFFLFSREMEYLEREIILEGTWKKRKTDGKLNSCWRCGGVKKDTSSFYRISVVIRFRCAWQERGLCSTAYVEGCVKNRRLGLFTPNGPGPGRDSTGLFSYGSITNCDSQYIGIYHNRSNEHVAPSRHEIKRKTSAAVSSRIPPEIQLLISPTKILEISPIPPLWIS